MYMYIYICLISLCVVWLAFMFFLVKDLFEHLPGSPTNAEVCQEMPWLFAHVPWTGRFMAGVSLFSPKPP